MRSLVPLLPLTLSRINQPLLQQERARQLESTFQETSKQKDEIIERTKHELAREIVAREDNEAQLASTQQQLAERSEQLRIEAAAREAKEAELASTPQQPSAVRPLWVAALKSAVRKPFAVAGG